MDFLANRKNYTTKRKKITISLHICQKITTFAPKLR